MLYCLTLVNDPNPYNGFLQAAQAHKWSAKFGSKRDARSIAAGYNALARETGAAPDDILLFIHQDARLLFDAPTVLAAYFKNLKRPGVLGFCGTQRQIPGLQWHRCEPTVGGVLQGDPGRLITFSTIGSGCMFKDGDVPFHYDNVEVVDGFAMAITKAAFDKIGGFDEGYTDWHGYDMELCSRALFNGYKNYVVHQKAWHISWGSSGPELDAALARHEKLWGSAFHEMRRVDTAIKMQGQNDLMMARGITYAQIAEILADQSKSGPEAAKEALKRMDERQAVVMPPKPAVTTCTFRNPPKGRLKIAVYTICRDEIKFCERFVASCKDADGIYVLDTGSTDGTPDALRKLGVDVQVMNFDRWKTLEEYDALVAEGKNPWRFDVARNYNIDMVPLDADVLFSVDLDEVLVPDWRTAVEAAWRPGVNHLSYFFAWSMVNGKPYHEFWYEKIHSRQGYRWVAPVHEAIAATADCREARNAIAKRLVEHYPDSSKPSHRQYLPLLELAVRESPDDVRERFYLGREYTFVRRWEDAIKSHTHYLSMPKATWRRERANAAQQIALCHSMLAIECGAREQAAVAAKNAEAAAGIAEERREHERQHLGWLLRAIAEDGTQREPWVALSDYGRVKGDNVLGYWAGKKALAIPEHANDKTFIAEPEAWGFKPHDLVSIMGWYLGKEPFKQESLTEAWTALSKSPWDERIMANYDIVCGCLADAAPARTPTPPTVGVIILSYAKSANEYLMTKRAIRSLRNSSPDHSMEIVVVETNGQLAREDFAEQDAKKGQLFGPRVTTIYPGGKFHYNRFLRDGWGALEANAGITHIVVMNNDVVLFNPGFMGHMLNGLKEVVSASPLGLREATWGHVDRSVPIDKGYDINRHVNGWFIMFDRRILKALPIDKLFPNDYSWYGGDIHYAKLLESCAYQHGLINAAQALHLQKSSAHLLGNTIAPPKDRIAMLDALGVCGKAYAEIGVEVGVYSAEILKRDPASLLLVDPWIHQKDDVYPESDGSNVNDVEFERRYQHVANTLGKDKRVTIARTFSVEAAKAVPDGSLDACYVDARHTKIAVAEDCRAWWPKVKSGGWLTGHDHQFPPVAEAVQEFCDEVKVPLSFVTTEPVSSWGVQKP